ncbi:MAG: proline--tRNA ligase, partial [Candidatus Marinimicrobia bacterium]|nr:proline--tRNA ligase [Candidatus Neomarinimicrobiota bacterium]
TLCIEAMMGDKKALQAGTSHYLGQNFAKAFEVKFQNEENKEDYVYATSWGVSTRLVGALIMVHGDDKGLRLPPKVAPIQVVVIPIVRKDDDSSELMDYLHPLISKLKDSGVRVHVDDRPKMSPGFKFNEWEMKGVPIRLEVGARDMENGEVFTARRDTGEKFGLTLDAASVKIPELLDEIQNSLFNQALEFRAENTHTASTWDEFKSIVEKGGFIKCGWDGTAETENKIKAETKATIRCIPFDEDPSGINCIFSGNAAKHQVVFSKAY